MLRENVCKECRKFEEKLKVDDSVFTNARELGISTDLFITITLSFYHMHDHSGKDAAEDTSGLAQRLRTSPNN